MSETEALRSGDDRSVMFAVCRNGLAVAHATIDAYAGGFRVHTTGTPEDAWPVFASRPRATGYAKSFCQWFIAGEVMVKMADPEQLLSLRELRESHTIVRSVITPEGSEGPQWAPVADQGDDTEAGSDGDQAEAGVSG